MVSSTRQGFKPADRSHAGRQDSQGQRRDGQKLGDKDFSTEFNSSPTLVGGTIYLLEKKGVMHMFEAGPEFKLVGTAELGEESTCCPAFVDGRIYIRGAQNLYCIGARK